jgi:hypothetical protein
MKNEDKESYLGGIESREGSVPLWLIIVYVLLLIWGGYYLVAFWGGFSAKP